MRISNSRLSIPKFPADTLLRGNILDFIKKSDKKFVFINAGAGYGKTILLSQITNIIPKPVWLSIRDESDLISFVNYLIEAIKYTLNNEFETTELMPLLNDKANASVILNEVLYEIEGINSEITLIIDDIHHIKDDLTKSFIANLIKYSPDNLSVIISSRETHWLDFAPVFARNSFLEVTQNDLGFSKEEISAIFESNGINCGYINEIYSITEGWCIAVKEIEILLKNGISISEIAKLTKDKIQPYFCYECILALPAELTDFLFLSAAFIDLDENMMDTVLEIDKSGQYLKILYDQNTFIKKYETDKYQYYKLFKQYLMTNLKEKTVSSLKEKAALYYFKTKQYELAAEYALEIHNFDIVQDIILVCYRDYIKDGKFNILNNWFNKLEDSKLSSPDFLIAKGVFLSAIGKFVDAEQYLDKAIYQIPFQEKNLYIYAMVHKARVLRNIISFEESNKLLDYLIDELKDLSDELAYLIIIEKLHNYCWMSKIDEAYALASEMIELCLKNDSLKVKQWYERYLTVIHFWAGRIGQSLYYFEKSLDITAENNQYIDMHPVGIYAAMAYKIAGNRERALELITSEIKRLKEIGQYEELWAAYMFAAETYYSNANIDLTASENVSLEEAIHNTNLAMEHALLYKKTDFQKKWTRIQTLSTDLIFSNQPNDDLPQEIEKELTNAPDYIKTLALIRIGNYYMRKFDYETSEYYMTRSLQIDEKANLMVGVAESLMCLARIAIIKNDSETACRYVKTLFQICSANKIISTYRIPRISRPLIDFALKNGIEPEFTAELIKFTNYKSKIIHIETLGGFAIFPYDNRMQQFKMKSKKERELFAFLLSRGSHGATKEQLYNAIWFDSNAADINSVIAVNITNLKSDLAKMGIDNVVVKREKHYSICMDEIELDVEVVEDLYSRFKQSKSPALARQILDLFRGDYLADFEALWSLSIRLKYQHIYDDIVESLNTSC